MLQLSYQPGKLTDHALAATSTQQETRRIQRCSIHKAKQAALCTAVHAWTQFSVVLRRSLCLASLSAFPDVLAQNSEHDVSRHAPSVPASNWSHTSAIAEKLILRAYRSIVPFRQFVECVKNRNHAAWSQEASEALKCAQALDA